MGAHHHRLAHGTSRQGWWLGLAILASCAFDTNLALAVLGFCWLRFRGNLSATCSDRELEHVVCYAVGVRCQPGFS
ncbi:hypothetical protein CDL12_13926 [Handroanthus impetiginosus]|uniref:Uncharacterized protein n=1 Tax=Handroanthus impetiginosus TaxID=429701 RepID=A0A2G9H818_9LAMI|nr:hypothetical protein CDL12_13926 [Handroanthus impetiginosus]